MGTIVTRQRRFVRTCFTALGKSTHRVILSTGRAADPASLGPVPANFIVRRHVPQLEVLQAADLFITHGGMNSVHEALSSGVPMIVIPHTAEQALLAERVAAVGAGCRLEPRQATPERLAAEVAAALANAEYRQNSRRIGELMRRAGGHVRAAEQIVSYLGSRASQS